MRVSPLKDFGCALFTGTKYFAFADAVLLKSDDLMTHLFPSPGVMGSVEYGTSKFPRKTILIPFAAREVGKAASEIGKSEFS